MKKILGAIGYWLIQLTWGSLLTIPGLLITLFCIIFLKGKPHKNGFSYIVEIGDDWGGLNLGAVSLCGTYSQQDTLAYDPEWFEHTRRHEFGHSIQNIILGPFQIFIHIASAIRYHYQNARYKKGLPNKDYDDIWFEYTASKWGHAWVNKIENTPEQVYTYKRK